MLALISVFTEAGEALNGSNLVKDPKLEPGQGDPDTRVRGRGFGVAAVSCPVSRMV